MLAEQQLGWIRRDWPGRDEIQILTDLIVFDDLVNRRFTGQERGHTLLRRMEMGMRGQCSLSDIHVNQYHPLIGLREAGRQVAGYIGLTGSRSEGAESNHLHVLRLDTHEVHIGTDDTECLRDHITPLRANSNAMRRILISLLAFG